MGNKKSRLYTSYDFVCVDNNNPCVIVYGGCCMSNDLPKLVNDMNSVNCRVMIVHVSKTPDKVFLFEEYSK